MKLTARSVWRPRYPHAETSRIFGDAPEGSHVKLRHPEPPAHTITVPLHNPLKTGTLHGILADVAQMRSMTLEQLAELL
jgi:hypothetical protein